MDGLRFFVDCVLNSPNPCSKTRPTLSGAATSKPETTDRESSSTSFEPSSGVGVSFVPVIGQQPKEEIGRQSVLDAFSCHFAGPERAKPVALADALSARPSASVSGQLEGDRLPSIVQLTSAFGRLKPNKAAGISGLPSEVFRAAPVLAAQAFWPVLLKSIVRGPFPFQWRGGAAVTVPKPGKASNELEGYRSVILLEPSAKAAQVAYRPLLHDEFLKLRTRVHFGGVAGAPLSLPAACVKAHLLHLNATGSSGGAVFVDCKSAYYSVAREVLKATPAQLADDEWAHRRAAIFFTQEADRRAFIAALRAHPAPAQLSHCPELATILRRQLEGTWFTTRPESHTVMQAESGTMPGSPVADLLFGVVFHRILSDINACLNELGCCAFPGFCQNGETSPTEPTWADDVCILFQVVKAQQLEEVLQAIMQVVTTAMQQQGLAANLGAGKTECMLVAHGPGSQTVRRNLLTHAQPSVSFNGPKGPAKVRLVPSYTHLGCVLRADGNDLPALRHREQQAQSMYGPVRRKLLCNPYLTEREKLEVFRSRILSSFLHGAGLLVLRTKAEQDKFTEVISRFHRGIFRPILSISSTGYSNEEIATILNLALPSELLDVARARTLADICNAGLDPVLRCLCSDQDWWSQAIKASVTVGLLPRAAETVDDLRRIMPSTAKSVSLACRRFLRTRCASRKFDRTKLVPRDEPDVPAVTHSAGPALAWPCHLCHQAFSGRRQLAVHLSKHHGQRPAQVRCAFGTSCQKCQVEFWSLRRLTEHLRKSDLCRAVYSASDIDADAPAPTTNAYAWQPAVRVEGPSPWWATLAPPLCDEPS
ncbi:unnamed protein product [Symbiodinium sp. CCMP2592]|nr:unnamed protein product [Symbiodinium sp. CCMP2592]